MGLLVEQVNKSLGIVSITTWSHVYEGSDALCSN
jgi:hypothetical protein